MPQLFYVKNIYFLEFLCGHFVPDSYKYSWSIDPLTVGTTVKDALKLFIEDNETDIIVLIGEIGGQLESDAAKWYSTSKSNKPVIGFIAGETAPAGRTMGHAGAIIGGKDDTAKAKKGILRQCGIYVVDSPAEIGKKVLEIHNKKS